MSLRGLKPLHLLSCIDYLQLTNGKGTAIDTISLLKPTLYIKGPDYKNFSDDVTVISS